VKGREGKGREGKGREGKRFFFEKKKQKTFAPLGSGALRRPAPMTQGHQSFFATFCSQKVVLTSLPH
jgi:hypothetical protein